MFTFGASCISGMTVAGPTYRKSQCMWRFGRRILVEKTSWPTLSLIFLGPRFVWLVKVSENMYGAQASNVWLEHFKAHSQCYDMPSHSQRKASPPTGRISMKFDIWVLFENLSRELEFHYSLTRHEDAWTFIIIFFWILFRMVSASHKSCRENQNTRSGSSNFLRRSCRGKTTKCMVTFPLHQ